MLYWAKERNEEKSPLLTHFTMHFNNVSQWTKARILERGVDMRGRVKIVLHFVAIMKALRETFNNFNSYLAILSAVESSPISRLDWPDRVVKSLEEPRALIDNKGSFKNYREAFATAKPPCIPYIGLYLQDLTFIEMQPKTLEDGVSINFTKRWKQFKSVDHIRFAQTKQYTFDPNPDILSLFANFENCATDEELWALSNEIKPSARAQRAQQQST
jgi:Rap guanine nucleotide exchange factor 1